MHSNMRQETQNVGIVKVQARLEWCVQMLQGEDSHSQCFSRVVEREHRKQGRGIRRCGPKGGETCLNITLYFVWDLH